MYLIFPPFTKCAHHIVTICYFFLILSTFRIDKNSAFDKLDLVLLRSFVKIQQSNKRIIKDKETISQGKSKI